jgi:hypothetical protein
LDKVEFAESNILPSLDSFTLTAGAYMDNDELILIPGSRANIRIETGEAVYKSSANKVVTRFKGEFTSIDNYIPKSFIDITVKYKEGGIQTFRLLLNNYKEVAEDFFEDTTVINTLKVGLEYIEVDIKVDSDAEYNLTVSGLELYKEALNEPIERIVEVVKIESAAIEVAYINNLQARNMTVEYVETNFDAIDPSKPYVPQRMYMRIYDNVIEYRIDEISENDLEDYKTIDGQQYYWSEIGEGPDAYKYKTLTDPVTAYEYRENVQLSGAEAEQLRERYKVKVRKATASYLKRIDTWGKRNNIDIPITIWGVGTGSPVDSSLQEFEGITLMKGQTLVYKDETGYYEKYFTNTGVIVRMLRDGNQSIEFRPNGFIWEINDVATSTWKYIESGGTITGLLNMESGLTINITESSTPI